MPLRPPAGFISAFYDPLKVADAPTAPAASGGDTQASVTFTAPGNTGGAPITQYYAVSNPGQITGNAASSPVTVTGLTNGTAYTFTVWALNSFGPSPYSGVSGSVTPAFQRGIFAGMQNISASYSNSIQYINIASTGNAITFGELAAGFGSGSSGNASSTRGVVAGGSSTNVIQYITLASLGNAINFGNLTVARDRPGACSNGIRCVFGGGRGISPENSNVIDYITISTLGNAIDFGDLTIARFTRSGVQSTTRGVFSAGNFSGSPFETNVMDYVTIATLGNAINFGNLTTLSSPAFLAGCSSSTRGLWATSNTAELNIMYITIASTGNTINFGNLTVARRIAQAASSKTRGVFAGGTDSGGGNNSNVIDYVTIATTGNAIDFGDLLGAFTNYGSGLSSDHGGLS